MAQGEEAEQYQGGEGHGEGHQEHETRWETGLQNCRNDAHTHAPVGFYID
jgi:hypothetical protein